MKVPATLRGYAIESFALIVGLGLRMLFFSPSYVLMQEDELGYAGDGLLLLEGVPLGFKFAPGAFTAWLGFAYGIGSWIVNTFRSLGSGIELPVLVRPLVTLDQTLFNIYADMSGLHAALAAASMLLSLLAIYAASRVGRYFADWPGALLVGGLTAVVPLFCSLSVQSRPYSPAWSLTVLSLFFVLQGGPRRWMWAGILYGLAVATRIDMLFIAPLIGWLIWIVPADQTRVRFGAQMAGTTILAFVVSAPWFVGHFVGNVRKIVTVVALGTGAVETRPIWSLMTEQGFAIVAIVTLLGLLFRCRTEPWRSGVALAYLLLLGAGLFVIITSGGLRHVGHTFLIMIVLSGYALGGIQQLFGRQRSLQISGVIAGLALLLPFVASLSMARETRSSWVEHDAVGWIESHVASGSRVFLARPYTSIPLPTEASADGIWGEAVRQTAWSDKLERRLAGIDVVLDPLPRGLSMEHMYQELAGLRRYFILGGGGQPFRPRYDLVLIPRNETDEKFRHALSEFLEDGGVFWHSGQPLDELGPPSRAWLATNGKGVFLYQRPSKATRKTIS
jgi:hypothetical protein